MGNTSKDNAEWIALFAKNKGFLVLSYTMDKKENTQSSRMQSSYYHKENLNLNQEVMINATFITSNDRLTKDRLEIIVVRESSPYEGLYASDDGLVGEFAHFTRRNSRRCRRSVRNLMKGPRISGIQREFETLLEETRYFLDSGEARLDARYVI